MTDTDTDFPVEWDVWRAAWREWFDAHKEHFKPTSFRWPGHNFLADDRLGTWSVNGINVELNDVTFSIGETRRYIGGVMGGSVSPHTFLASSFDELEKVLGIA